MVVEVLCGVIIPIAEVATWCGAESTIVTPICGMMMLVENCSCGGPLPLLVKLQPWKLLLPPKCLPPKVLLLCPLPELFQLKSKLQLNPLPGFLLKIHFETGCLYHVLWIHRTVLPQVGYLMCSARLITILVLSFLCFFKFLELGFHSLFEVVFFIS